MKGFIKKEVRATTNEDGSVAEWREAADQTPEYWSERALQKLPLSELYPQDDNETKKDYNERLRLIGEFALSEYDEKVPHKLEKRYPDGYPYGKIINKQYEYDNNDPTSGYKFVELEENPERLKINDVEKALKDADKARETGELEYRVGTPNVYASQQEIARYYIGALSSLEKAEQPGIFQHVGEDRYTEDDADFVEKQRKKYAEKDKESSESEALRIAGKMFEGFFYPLVSQGFFDAADGRTAAFMPTSEYDDDKNSADAAVVIPIRVKNQDREVVSADVPICFDLTSGSGDGKIERIEDKFIKGKGFTGIKYPATCLGESLNSMTNIPHFALCLPREKELGEFVASLAAEKPLSDDIQNLINFQLYAQARYWMEYWDKRKADKTQESADKAQLHAGIAAFFGRRLVDGSKSVAGDSKELLVDITKQHEKATRYLTETIFS